MLREIINTIWMDIVYTIAVLAIVIVYMTRHKNADKIDDIISSAAYKLVDNFK